MSVETICSSMLGFILVREILLAVLDVEQKSNVSLVCQTYLLRMLPCWVNISKEQSQIIKTSWGGCCLSMQTCNALTVPQQPGKRKPIV